MPFPITIQTERGRLLALRCTIVVALILGMLASWKLWLGARTFPMLPIGAWFPQLTPPWDAVLFAFVLIALVALIWFPRSACWCFLFGALLLYGGDQNRGQPWFYLYCVLLFITLLPEIPALAAGRIVVSAVYVWAGLQKLGPDYRESVMPYMMQPVTSWLPVAGAALVKWCLLGAPFAEVFIGVGLWIPKLRRAAIITTVAIHVVALLILGPLGHNQNLVVWPWNLAMVAFVIILFPQVSLVETWRALRRSAIAVTTTALVVLLPALNHAGWWDSYFSFALYSGNTAKADLIIVPSLVPRLPEELRGYAHPLHEDVIAVNPGMKGLWVFDMQTWAVTSLDVPPIPEPRNYRSMAKAVARFADQPTDLQLIVFPRRGPAQIFRADQLR
jgi:hypothetical protein